MKKSIPALAMALLAIVATSCGGSSNKWTYKTGLEDGELGYVTLYGEQDNVEANDRKDGVIKALNEIAKDLYNPKTGKKGVTVKDYGTLLCAEGKNTWNGEKAKALLQPILTKHKGKIDLISSNNDGMAVAVSSLNNLPKNTPIVGFDALTDACQMIKEGTLAGSVTQNGDDQALLALTILTNMLGGKTNVTEGYTKTNLESSLGAKHIYQTKISAVTAQNADQFKPGAYDETVAENTTAKGKKLLVALYNQTDNFIQETYHKAIQFYAKKMGYKVTIINGGDTDKALQQSLIAANSKEKHDVFAFNMIEHTAYKDYLDIAGGAPVVFFNRQPREGKNTIEDISKITDKSGAVYEKCYFVGTAAGGQGTAQGQVVKDFFTLESQKAEQAK